MRLSARKDDPGYRPDWESLLPITVLLDGVEVPKCITADEELGYVKFFALDERGNTILAPCRTECVTREATGQVQIFLRGQVP